MAKVYASEREMLDELMGTSKVVETERQPDNERIAAIYHEMCAGDEFDDTASALFELVREAVTTFPEKRRALYLDVEGHRNVHDGFDDAAYEIQRNYVCEFLSQWLHEAHMPLMTWLNNDVPSNDIPDRLEFRSS